MRGTLAPVLDELRAPFLVAHGYNSATVTHDLAEMTRQHDRPTQIIYVGDFDPSGLHMSEADLPRRLSRYGGKVKTTRVGITEDDVLHSSLPDFPASDKTKDPRHRWFTHTHGQRCMELDAMPPPELRARVRTAILAHIDGEAWEHSLEREAEQLDRLAAHKDRIVAMLEAVP